jgi:hypothetical protein
VERRAKGFVPDPQEIAELRARAATGDERAIGRLGELLAKSGDLEGALRVFSEGFGGSSVHATTKRLADLKAEEGDLRGAVSTWELSDVVWQNPEGVNRQAYLDELDDLALDDDPSDWGYIQAMQLTVLLAERGDEEAIAQLRAGAANGHLDSRAGLARAEKYWRTHPPKG